MAYAETELFTWLLSDTTTLSLVLNFSGPETRVPVPRLSGLRTVLRKESVLLMEKAILERPASPDEGQGSGWKSVLSNSEVCWHRFLWEEEACEAGFADVSDGLSSRMARGQYVPATGPMTAAGYATVLRLRISSHHLWAGGRHKCWRGVGRQRSWRMSRTHPLSPPGTAEEWWMKRNLGFRTIRIDAARVRSSLYGERVKRLGQ